MRKWNTLLLTYTCNNESRECQLLVLRPMEDIHSIPTNTCSSRPVVVSKLLTPFSRRHLYQFDMVTSLVIGTRYAWAWYENSDVVCFACTYFDRKVKMFSTETCLGAGHTHSLSTQRCGCEDRLSPSFVPPLTLQDHHVHHSKLVNRKTINVEMEVTPL